MLRQFHYIDQNGKDQGINVRNRAKELAELLSDVDRIRSERKKAKGNRNKFGGVEGGATGSSSSGGSRYGGFGNDEYGGYSGGVYGDGGGFGGRESGFQDTQNRRDKFEEYDEYDEVSASTARRRPEISATLPKAKKVDPPKPKEPEIDLLEDIPPETPPKEFGASSMNGKKPAPGGFDDGFGSLQSGGADDDDFDDFQSATPTISNTTTASSIPTLPPPTSTGFSSQNTQFAAPKPMAPASTPNFAGLSGATSPPPSSIGGTTTPSGPNYYINMSVPTSAFSPQPTQQQSNKPTTQHPTPSTYQPSAPNYFTSVQVPQANNTPPVTAAGRPAPSTTSSFSKPTTKPASAGGDAFGNIWSSASSGAGIKKSATASSNQGPNLASLQREKASQGLWGMGAPPQQSSTPAAQPGRPAGGIPGMGSGISNGQKGGTGGAMDDLLG